MIENFLLYVAAFVVVLAPLVFIHELGHFLAAKSFGVGVPVFSLGFGPRLFGFDRGGTDYRVSAIPLGGYVRMRGDESDETRTGAADEFLSRPRWQRFVVYVAGPAFNVVLAFLVLWLYFGLYGKPVTPEIYPTIVEVAEGSTAEAAGLERGERIISIAGRDVKSPETMLDAFLMQVRLAPNTVVPITVERDGARRTVRLPTGEDPEDGSGAPGLMFSWGSDKPPVIEQVLPGEPAEAAGLEPGDVVVAAGGRRPVGHLELRMMLMDSPGKPVPLTVRRGDDEVELSVTPRTREDGTGLIGVQFESTVEIRRLSLAESARESLAMNVELSRTLFVVLKKLFTREVSVKSLSGPIGIAQFARNAIDTGFDAFLYLLAFFSLQLGILNLLPIPVLDGGHILILGVEGVMRRPLSERVKELVITAGFVFLLGLMGLIIYLDVVKTL